MAPKATKARWFRLEREDLHNVTDEYPSGDKVATMVPWEAKSLWADTTNAGLNEALDLIAAGPEPGVMFNATRRGGSNRWVGNAILRTLGLNEKQAAQMIAEWIKNGTLEEVEYHHPIHRRLVPGVRVNDARRPGLTL
jgi:hypothetical protein